MKKGKGAKKLEDKLLKQMQSYGLRPVPQFKMPEHNREWRFDFCFPDERVLIEVQGGIHMRGGKGAHNRGANMEEGFIKHNTATIIGYRVLFFGPKHIEESMYAIETIWQILKGKNRIQESQPLPQPELFSR